MPVLTPDLFWNLADEVLDCVCTALDVESECECPCRQFVAVGRPVWDNCCEGQTAVFIERIYPHGNFPAQDAGVILCQAPFAGEYTVQHIRCAPTVKDNGDPPTPGELTEASRLLYQEMYIALRAVVCCLAPAKRDRKFSIRGATPVGPQGGCHGFEIRFSVELHDPAPTP